MAKLVGLLALAVLTVACQGSVTEPGADQRADSPTVHVWPADADLRVAALEAADRLSAATGLAVFVDDAPGVESRPLFWADPGDEWLGMNHEAHNDFLAIASASRTDRDLVAAVVLHEMLHALGASHIAYGAGVMSDGVWAGAEITTADLDALCLRAPCTVFQPEAEIATPPVGP